MKIFNDPVKETKRRIKANYRLNSDVKNPYIKQCKLATERLNENTKEN